MAYISWKKTFEHHCWLSHETFFLQLGINPTFQINDIPQSHSQQHPLGHNDRFRRFSTNCRVTVEISFQLHEVYALQGVPKGMEASSLTVSDEWRRGSFWEKWPMGVFPWVMGKSKFSLLFFGTSQIDGHNLAWICFFGKSQIDGFYMFWPAVYEFMIVYGDWW